MTRVDINGRDHQVVVDHDGADLTYVVEKAQKLYAETRPAASEPGPAFGFVAERAHRRDGFAWKMGNGEQPVVES